jgi:adenylate cyclase
VLAVRSGIRNNNDLIWVGRAPNIAAKMSAIRESPYHSFLTADVHKKLADEAKLHEGKEMWESRNFPNSPVKEVYRSSWTWKP